MSNQVIDASTILSWLQNRIAQELDCTVDEVDFEQPLDLLGLDSVWAGDVGGGDVCN